ncbi:MULTISPECIES: hypothetical protein [Streptomyces]|uniref:Uncharacterized protein n=2 Tax=Streptomyces rimosus subsp. rimosus TaxID=132474 RepID=L8EXA1_STRR1|nr:MULTISPECIES: hypothetical protein [Streptomyces]KOG71604.1 hypothetical protein ADK78_23775 [Kitasatospora aureofaciens]MYT48170.1 hypothetical protein [Streptomyces sp. SID5471]KEF07966.1 hypothetical protein DF17_06660 [Streptomyces rimosus]KEF21069.1 hypothetical protein DF18_07625 [Streptomyces rimosus]KOT34397.1 hypothetical protein ADK84_24035 [Streptomyces sp. NRRL WC-3701]
MSAQPEEPPEELVPRPDLAFPSLRAALARVAPARLPEMLADRDVQFTRATESGSFEPIKGFQLKWATVIEMKRRRDLDQRMEAAQHIIHTLDRDAPEWRAAMDEVRDVYNEARRAVTGG